MSEQPDTLYDQTIDQFLSRTTEDNKINPIVIKSVLLENPDETFHHRYYALTAVDIEKQNFELRSLTGGIHLNLKLESATNGGYSTFNGIQYGIEYVGTFNELPEDLREGMTIPVAGGSIWEL